MVGVCMTVISVMQLLPKSAVSPWADKMLAIDSLVFLISALVSYRALRNESPPMLEHYADWLFLTGLGIMVVAGTLVSFELFLV